jgi:hypothetical protein
LQVTEDYIASNVVVVLNNGVEMKLEEADLAWLKALSQRFLEEIEGK